MTPEPAGDLEATGHRIADQRTSPYIQVSPNGVAPGPTYLWLDTLRCDLVDVSAPTEPRLAHGHRVGEVACPLVPDALLTEDGGDWADAQGHTKLPFQEALTYPWSEAPFAHGGVLVRADSH